jgi:hypothetical protein
VEHQERVERLLQEIRDAEAGRTQPNHDPEPNRD